MRTTSSSKSLTDDKAKKLIDEAVAIEQAEANIKSTFAPQLSKVLPVKKVRVTCRSRTRSALRLN